MYARLSQVPAAGFLPSWVTDLRTGRLCAHTRHSSLRAFILFISRTSFCTCFYPELMVLHEGASWGLTLTLCIAVPTSIHSADFLVYT